MGIPLYRYLFEGFTLGLSLGITCVSTCGPIYLPYIMGARQKGSSALVVTLHITLGRFLTYLLFGAVAGIIGKGINEVSRSHFTAVAYIGLSLLLIYQAIIRQKEKKDCTIKSWQKYITHPFVLGVVTGINFCPAFLIALTRSFQLSGIIAGVCLFFAFFLGTSIFILPLSLGGLFTKWDRVREIAKLVAIFIGIWYLYQGLLLVYKIIYKGGVIW